jgi:hypothetical protein
MISGSSKSSRKLRQDQPHQGQQWSTGLSGRRAKLPPALNLKMGVKHSSNEVVNVSAEDVVSNLNVITEDDRNATKHSATGRESKLNIHSVKLTRDSF